MAALEALLPEELERHCQLQRSRLDTYQKLIEEVVLFVEARGYVAPKLGQAAKAREDRDDPMDAGGFGQWKGDLLPRERESTPLAKGKEQENTVQSHQDKRTRRRFQVSVGFAGKQVIDRRIAGQGLSSNRIQGPWNTLGKGNDVKGKSGKSGGKESKSKHAGALVWNQQTGSPVASSVASSAMQTETSTTVGTIDAIECAALDLCATTMAQQEVVNHRWMAFNVDTGSWWNCGRRMQVQQVTGEMVEGQGRF